MKKKRSYKRKRKNSTSFLLKRPAKRRKKTDPQRCELVICEDEKCHHFRFIKYLKMQRKTYKICFFSSLLPYQEVYQQKKNGIRKGEPDFYIPYPYKCKKTNKEYIGLGIELKCGRGKLSKVQKTVIREFMNEDHIMIAVCYGWKSCKKVMMGYRKGIEYEELQKLCWEDVDPVTLTKKK